MSVNKNALLRYKVLDRCFRNTARRYFIEDLLGEVNKELEEFNGPDSGVKRRQLLDDIRFMKSDQGWSIPLDHLRSGKRVYYRYTDPDFSINSEPLNETEKNKIVAAISVLSRFSGAPQFEWIQEMIPLLEDRLGLTHMEQEVISLESNVDLQGLHFMPLLYDAIVNRIVLDVTYKDFRAEEPYLVRFHPYYLKQYNNRWFTFGLNSENGISTWNLALDRIQNIEQTSFEYQHQEIDWQDYFFDMIGVTRSGDSKTEHVVLKIDSSLEPYLKTKPLHASQRVSRESGKTIITLDIIVNFELEALLMSFGENIIVREPEYLREKISNRLHTAFSLYT